MIGDFATKPLEGALFRKFRDQINGSGPARDPGQGKPGSGVSKTESSKNKPKKVKSIRLVPPGKGSSPQECVGSLTRDRAKLGLGRVEKISDIAILNQSRGKSVLPAHAACVKR
jgi:hypothetical protein